MWPALNRQRAQTLGRERAQLANVVNTVNDVGRGLSDAKDLLDMAVAEVDEAVIEAVVDDINAFDARVKTLEFHRMFSGETDANNCFLDVQAGSGGTEAQDWAEMLLRMYLRWGERHGFKIELMEVSAGDVAGIKSATVRYEGDYAFGWLRTKRCTPISVRNQPNA